MIQLAKKHTKDIRKGPICTIDIPKAIPSYWKWRAWHWSKQRKLQEDWEWLLTAESSKIPVGRFMRPVRISFTVYKKFLKGDETNLVTPFDKLVLDNITEPKGNKRRGLGWIPDDTPEWVKVDTPTIRKAVDGKERTVIQFFEWR